MLFAATWMDLELIIISEVSQKENKYYMISLLCEILKILQNFTNLKNFTKQKQTHRHRKQIYGYQRGKVVRYKLGTWD